MARTPDKAKHLGIEVRPGDYNDKNLLEKSLQRVDVLLLVSGMDAPEKRIEQHRNVIHAAQNAGVKKIVYTSVQGAEKNTAFSPVVQSNRQTEKDVSSSGLDWVVGRNGIYIEPDIEYIDTDLVYTPMTVEEYRKERAAELGEFLGTVIDGIYQGIREGKYILV